ncbi:MAG: hypothetical protein H6828_05340 [Planctomycetes bacterium]|nr:hypothetical protein [Planctomycetota bacterium]
MLEPHYWKLRLQQQRAVGHFLLRLPRPDLSSAGCEVEEFSFRAHDGVRLRGLIGRCPLFRTEQPAHIRTLGACKVPDIDVELVQSGRTEILIQFPAGRRLEDKVLDVLRVCELARELDSVDCDRVELATSETAPGPDELRIAADLRALGLSA